jgi:hypothetical protein
MSRASSASRIGGRSRTDASSGPRSGRTAQKRDKAAIAEAIAAPANTGEPLALTSGQVCDEILRLLARLGCHWG